MVKFYFFKVCREMNAQRQYRTVLHPLPGQTTYVNQRETGRPLDTALKVQVASRENSKVCRLVTDTVVGVAIEGRTLRDTKLGIYTRDEQEFYRAEGELLLVDNPYYLSSQVTFIRYASDCYPSMMEAYNLLSNSDARGEEAPQAPRTAEESAEAVANTTMPSTATVISTAPQRRVDTTELESIESNLLDTLPERETLGKLLIISQIRDRMRIGVAKFSFLKQNGDTRLAYGTRNPDVIRLCGGDVMEQQERQDGGPDGEHFHYFDVQKRAWRCFCVEDIISVTSEMPIVDTATIRLLSENAA